MIKIKKIFNKLKSNILLCTIVFLLIFIISKVILNILGLEYMQYIYKFLLFAVVIGTIVGLIQIAIKSKSKIVKACISTFLSLTVIFTIAFLQIVLLFYVAYFPPEHIVVKENKKMVGYVYGFLRTRVDYYNYINIFLRKKNISFSEDYGKGGFDPIENPNIHTVQDITYYNKNGEIIRDKNNDVTENQEQQTYNYEEEYEIFFNDKEGSKIDIVDTAMGQEAIKVYSTTDGMNWTSQLETTDQILWVHYNSKFLFVNPQIGFIYDPGRDDAPEDYATLLVTLNGGKSYQNCKIEYPNNITEKNLLIKDLPTYEDGILKLTIYTLNHNKNSKRTYYEFVSSDGLNWTYNKEL